MSVSISLFNKLSVPFKILVIFLAKVPRWFRNTIYCHIILHKPPPPPPPPPPQPPSIVVSNRTQFSIDRYPNWILREKTKKQKWGSLMRTYYGKGMELERKIIAKYRERSQLWQLGNVIRSSSNLLIIKTIRWRINKMRTKISFILVVRIFWFLQSCLAALKNWRLVVRHLQMI